jgi:DNA-binding transcriptional LysR family regulator
MLPDFNRLRVFYFVFRNKSVANAALQLNISPSAVSQSLNKLESELKIPLFTRLHKKLVPTLAGEQLFETLEPFVADLENCIVKMARARQIPSGMLRIGSPIEFGKSYFPGIFASFRKQYPDVVFTLKLGDPSEIFPMIREGSLDFGLVDVFLTRDQVFEDFGIYSIEPVIEEEVIMACSKEYYDKNIKGDHSFRNLSSREFISYQKSSLTLRNWFKHHFHRFSPELNRVLTVDNHQAVITAIKNHLGMGVIASHIVSRDIKKGRIIPIKTGKNDVVNKISLVLLQDKIPNLTEKAFLQFLKTDILSSGRFKKFMNIAY